MPSTAELTTQIDRFQLDVKGNGVYPVYWIATPDYSPKVFKGGKGSSDALQGEVDRILAECEEKGEETNIINEGSARHFLYRNLIGLDCSGFVYHVADGILKTEDPEASFQNTLFIPKQRIINVAERSDSWRNEYQFTENEKQELPDLLSMQWVTSTFKKDPENLTDTVVLSSDKASARVENYEDAKPGDLVIMSSTGKYKHVGMITEVNGNEWKVWDSYRTDEEYEGYGGLMSHEVTVVDFKASLQEQQWENFKTQRYDRYDLRRLYAFAA